MEITEESKCIEIPQDVHTIFVKSTHDKVDSSQDKSVTEFETLHVNEEEIVVKRTNKFFLYSTKQYMMKIIHQKMQMLLKLNLMSVFHPKMMKRIQLKINLLLKLNHIQRAGSKVLENRRTPYDQFPN